MNKIKKICMFLLLLIMTVCVIFLPQLMSEQNEENLLNKTTYWDYNMRSSTKITSEQVAQLYYNREIDISPIPLDEETYDTSTIEEDFISLFEIVFESNESICNHMKMKLPYGSSYYSKTSILTMIDNYPIALNFIGVIITTVDGTLEFIYEEKTKTLIRFSHYSLSYPLDYGYKDDSFLNALNSTVESYYENQLRLGAEEYYYQYEIVDKTDLQCYSIDFGISQHLTEFDEKESEIIYNSDTY